MLTGAVIGGATAFVGGQVHAAFGILGDVGMMGAGVGLSMAKGGPESLAYMAASFAGSIPMPFFFGVRTDVQPYQLPFNIPFFGGTVGIPNNLQITVDPILNRFLYPNQHN